ncbi:hypothetical protein NQ504_02985 [Ligilactobacillus ruminis]|uniref:rRNA biogenesis protein rrp5 n=1 Tax=Ligilactobacillus ruminis ATCC 25644 TaxID=525362 RepID=E7FSQ7_9LACO|nr:hypothetical protein [Ligilactobacillus ruminis]EFZ33940.1 hypothetical protein HMPREF0542_11934 [Ligilactobacillus ruminis ATCC 25644]EGX99239.1 hypothetical protein ANHS_196 [Ligilactobacillus ruminis ATCC 25644]UWP40677.1 hypothetical protein NQ504_02985 [Ligilactobacillus ruminis]
MSRTKLLLNIKIDLGNLAADFAELAAALEQPQSSEPDLELPPKPEIKLEDVRKELAKKASEGHSDEIRKLLKTYGAEKLSDVDPKDYEDLFLEAQGVGQ